MARKANTYRGARRRQARALARFMLSDWQINGGKERPTFRAIWPAFMLDATATPIKVGMSQNSWLRGAYRFFGLDTLDSRIADANAMIARHMRAA